MSLPFEAYLFVSSSSKACAALAPVVSSSLVPLKIIRLDSKDVREVAMSGKFFSIDSVPSLVIVHTDGNVQLLKGATKASQWVSAMNARLTPPPPPVESKIEHFGADGAIGGKALRSPFENKVKDHRAMKPSFPIQVPPGLEEEETDTPIAVSAPYGTMDEPFDVAPPKKVKRKGKKKGVVINEDMNTTKTFSSDIEPEVIGAPIPGKQSTSSNKDKAAALKKIMEEMAAQRSSYLGQEESAMNVTFR